MELRPKVSPLRKNSVVLPVIDLIEILEYSF